jgi:hypothetical protein
MFVIRGFSESIADTRKSYSARCFQRVVLRLTPTNRLMLSSFTEPSA